MDMKLNIYHVTLYHLSENHFFFKKMKDVNTFAAQTRCCNFLVILDSIFPD